MIAAKPISRFLHFALTLVLLLSFFASFTVSEPTNAAADTSAVDDDSDEIEELIALDEAGEEEEEANPEDGTLGKSYEAEVLTKAQRIVLELNADNARRAIDGNEYVLVLGYAPWCSRSAELMPQFAEAATSLKELGASLLMAKIDGDRHPKAASSLGIKGYPTLVLFVNGSSQAYTGGFTSEEIVIWARKKTGVPVTRLSTIAEATNFLKKHTVFALGLFEKFEGPQYEEFVKAASADNEIQFVEVSDPEIAKVLYPEIKLNNVFLGLVKSEPERYTAYDDAFEVDKIIQFVDYNKFPLVNVLNELNYVRVYGSPIKLQVLVFAQPDDFKKLLEPLQDAARKFKNKVMFVYVDIRDENLAKPLLTLFGLEESKHTVVAAFDNKISSKYLLETDPTQSSIEEFCLALLQKSLSPYFKSKPVPDNSNATVQTVVGKTFDELVLASPVNVLLEVHTPWCINCEATSKQMDKLAKHFKGSDNVVFARIDASENEHPKLQVNDYPALLFYSAGDKSIPIKLSAKSSLKDLAKFISKKLKPHDQLPKDEL